MVDKKTVEKGAAESSSVASASSEVTVYLIGSQAQKTGEHGIYADGRAIAIFHDGVATVEPASADKLRELGLIE